MIKVIASAVMLNVLGQHMEQAQTYVAENPSAHLHLYGKIEAKHNRKMGHVTVLGEDAEEFIWEGNHAGYYWRFGNVV